MQAPVLSTPGDISYLIFPAAAAMEPISDRDYRFFEPDMVHPNIVALDYVWGKLIETMFSDGAIKTMSEVSFNFSRITAFAVAIPPSDADWWMSERVLLVYFFWL